MTRCSERRSVARALPVIAIALWLTTAPSRGRAEAARAEEASRFERSVTPAAGGPTRLDVDVPLLAGAEAGAGLRDLRIADAEGHEVPYILVPPRPSAEGDATWRRGAVLSIPPTSTSSGFEVDSGASSTSIAFGWAGSRGPS